MKNEFSGINFLKPKVKFGALDKKGFGQGSFCYVAELNNLPESTKEKVPNGYVIKRYRYPEFSDELVDLLQTVSNEWEHWTFWRIIDVRAKNKNFSPITEDEYKEMVATRLKPPTYSEVKTTYEKYSAIGMAKELKKETNF